MSKQCPKCSAELSLTEVMGAAGVPVCSRCGAVTNPSFDEYVTERKQAAAVVKHEQAGKTVAEIFAESDRRAAIKCTVAEMIVKLQALEKPDATVVLEGCDCVGRASGEVVVDAAGDVLLKRVD